MGVSGLSKKLKGKGSAICLSDVAQQAPGMKLLVDGLGVVFSIWFDSCTSIFDNVFPAFDRFEAKFLSFVQSFAELGIELVFYFDTTSGTEARYKKAITVSSRQEQQVTTALSVIDFCNGKLRGELPRTNEILPSNLMWHAQTVLERNSVAVVRCLGEADFQLSADGADPAIGAYAVLSNDSDFFLSPGIRYIPFETVVTKLEMVADSLAGISAASLRQKRIYCSVFDRELVMKELGLTSAEGLFLFSALAGNDYTKQLLTNERFGIPRRLGLKTLPWGTPTIESCVAFVNQREAVLPLITELCNEFPEVKSAFLFSSQSVDQPLSLVDRYDPAYDAVVAKVQKGELPSNTMGILIHGYFLAGIMCEEYDSHTGVSAMTISRHLFAAGCHFLNRLYIAIQERHGTQLETAMWDLTALLPPSYYTKQRTFQLLDMVNIIYETLHIFPCVDTTHDAGPEYLQLLMAGGQVFHARPFFQGQLLSHLVASSTHYNDPITAREFFALVLMMAIIDVDPSFTRSLPSIEQKFPGIAGKTGNSKQVQGSYGRGAPTARSVTLASRIVKMLSLLRGLYKITQFHVFGTCPAIGDLFNGPLFCFILHELEFGSARTPASAVPADTEGVPLDDTVDAGFAVDPASWDTVNDMYLSLAGALESLTLPGLDKLKRSTKMELVIRLQLQLAGYPFPSQAIPLVTKAPALLEEKEEKVDDCAQGPVLDPADLPIAEHKEILLQTVDHNCVTVIQGETGCGKSSQVPQYVLQHQRELHKSGKAARRPFIIVTQPRRIAAITLAKRVAHELGEPLGHSVGYSIGQDRVGDEGSNRTEIYFVTSGWLLQKLLFDSNFLSRCTHIILDEIHERSIDSDLLYLLVRQATLHLLKKCFRDSLPAHKKVPKLVLMSATFNTELFADYFQPCNDQWYANGELEDLPDERGNPDAGELDVPIMFVGVKRFPVEIVHLDEMLDHPIFASKEMSWGHASVDMLCRSFKKGQQCRSQDQLVAFTVAALSALVYEHRQTPEGSCILIFLPGIAEIEELYEMIEQMKESAVDAEVETVVLHSMIDHEDQMKAFASIATGVTRIVLSTNIAESSVTIPQVRYVFDFGTCRQLEHERETGLTALKTAWISKASAMQRSGRCGRLFPGTAFRMYPLKFGDTLAPYDVPEMLRLSLTSTVLRLKVLSESVVDDSPFKNPREVLQCALQPPDEAAIDAAVDRLVTAGALFMPTYTPPTYSDEDSEAEDSDDELFGTGIKPRANDPVVVSTVTPFGQFLSHVPLDMRFGKLVALGARSGRFILHTIVIAVGLSMQDLFVLPYSFTDDVVGFTNLILTTQGGRQYYEAGDRSDALAVIRLFLDYIRCDRGPRGASSPLYDLAINMKRMKALARTVGEIASRLTAILPHHSKWLQLLGRSGRIPVSVLEHEMSMNEADCNFLRLLMAQAFASDGLVEGKYKSSASGLGLGKHGLPPAKSVDLNRTVVIQEVPVQVMSSWAIRHSIPAIANYMVRVSAGNHFSQRKPKAGRALAVGDWGSRTAGPVQCGRMVVEFTDDASKTLDGEVNHVLLNHLNGSRRPQATTSDEEWELELPVLGMRAMLSMFQRGQLVVLPLTPDGQIIQTASKKRGQRRDWRDEENDPSIERIVLSQPTRANKMQWKLRGTIGCTADNHSVIASLQATASSKGRSFFYAIPSCITMLGSGSQARVEKMSVLPNHNGLFALLILTVYNGEPLTTTRGHILTAKLPNSVLISNHSSVALNPAPSADLVNSPAVQGFKSLLQSLLSVDISSPPCGLFNEHHLEQLLQGFVDGQLPPFTPSERKSMVDDEEFMKSVSRAQLPSSRAEREKAKLSQRQQQRQLQQQKRKARQEAAAARAAAKKASAGGRAPASSTTNVSPAQNGGGALPLTKSQKKAQRKKAAKLAKQQAAAAARAAGSDKGVPADVAHLSSAMGAVSLSAKVGDDGLTKKQRRTLRKKEKADAAKAAALDLSKAQTTAHSAPASTDVRPARKLTKAEKNRVAKVVFRHSFKSAVKEVTKVFREQSVVMTVSLAGGKLKIRATAEGAEIYASTTGCDESRYPVAFAQLKAAVNKLKSFLPEVFDSALSAVKPVTLNDIQSSLGSGEPVISKCKSQRCSCSKAHTKQEALRMAASIAVGIECQMRLLKRTP